MVTNLGANLVHCGTNVMQPDLRLALPYDASLSFVTIFLEQSDQNTLFHIGEALVFVFIAQVRLHLVDNEDCFCFLPTVRFFP
jgi:hypothetical protein